MASLHTQLFAPMDFQLSQKMRMYFMPILARLPLSKQPSLPFHSYLFSSTAVCAEHTTDLPLVVMQNDAGYFATTNN